MTPFSLDLGFHGFNLEKADPTSVRSVQSADWKTLAAV
jgi:hypothetical protein